MSALMVALLLCTAAPVDVDVDAAEDDVDDAVDAVGQVQVVVFDERGDAAVVEVGLGEARGTSPATFTTAAGTWPLVVDGQPRGAVVVAAGAMVDVVITLGGAGVDRGSVDTTALDPADGAASSPGSPTTTTTNAPTTAATKTATLRVRVRSLLDGLPVAGARVDVRADARNRGRAGDVDDEGVLLIGVPLAAPLAAPLAGEARATPVELAVVAAGHAPRLVSLSLAADQNGAVVDVEVALLPLATELDELTVRAPHVRGGAAASASARREEKQLVEVLGREEMQRSGDSDAAAALRRVTGLTVVGGRYVYVRGLGDRYSSTLVNGAPLPSPEPERRVVPLDLFPAPLLDALVVQKTWSPDLPGEFGGGSVQLKTRDGSDELLVSLSATMSFVPGRTFSDQLLPVAGFADLFGVDDGRRALPADVRAASDDAPLAEGNALTGGGLTAAELEDLGEQLGAGAWSPTSQLVLPGLSLAATVADTVATPVGSLGVIGAVTWSGDTVHTDVQRKLTAAGDGDDGVGGAGDGVVVTDDLAVSSTERTVAWGTFLGLGWRPAAGQRLRATTLINRDAGDEARVVTGFDDEVGGDIRLTRLRLVQRQLVVQQLGGEHTLPWSTTTMTAPTATRATTDPADATDATTTPATQAAPLSVSWRAGYALALRDEPGQRTTRYDAVDDGGAGGGAGSGAKEPRFLLSDRSDGNQMLWSSLVEHGFDSQVALRVPFVQWSGLDAAAHVGVAAAGRVRDVDTRRFKFLASGARAGDRGLRARTPDEIFVEENIGPDTDNGAFQIGEATRNTDNHTGSALIAAGFAGVEAPIGFGPFGPFDGDDVIVSAGLRLEASRLEVTTFELFNAAAPPVTASLTNLDVLPALGVAWTVVDDVVLKGALARTVVRPELRELSPAVYTDVAGGRARFGNPLLQETGLVHADVRVELALSPQDGVALALFGKHFDRPIESVVTAGADQAITAENVEAAVNAGVEVDGRLSLPTALRLLDVGALTGAPSVLDGLWIGGNAALIASRVVIGEEQQGTLTSTERSLEGQSPWVMNLQAGYDGAHDDAGFSAAVLYNVFGPRIVEVGALGLPDVYELPVHQLDVVVRQKLPWGLAASLKAQNLLDLPAERLQGATVVERVTRGRVLSLGLSWTL